VLSGRRISISPRNVCDGTPACTGLVASKTYYVKSSAKGMLKDRIGTKFGTMDTKSTWRFTTTLDSAKRPEVYYNAGFAVKTTATVTGYIYFSENVQDIGTGKLSVIDCGGDLDCGVSNSAAITDAALTFGDGSTTDGTKDYGMLKYVKVLPLASRKYQISVPLGLVKDTAITTKSGPSAAYSFYVNVGTVPAPSPDTAAPVITYKTPWTASGDPGAKAAKASNIVLYFNEDVQAVSGKVKFCLNSNTDDSSANTPHCTAGRYFDQGSATFDISYAHIDRRVVTMNPSRDLKIGQKLYVLMPAGVVADLTTPRNTNTATTGGFKGSGANSYIFKVNDEDTIGPTLQWFDTPKAMVITLLCRATAVVGRPPWRCG
jgi:hypothetical protein